MTTVHTCTVEYITVNVTLHCTASIQCKKYVKFKWDGNVTYRKRNWDGNSREISQ